MADGRLRWLPLVVACAAALVAAACGDDSTPQLTTASAQSRPASSGASEASGSDDPEASLGVIDDSSGLLSGSPVADGAIKGATPCPPATGSPTRVTSFEQPPPLCIDPAKTYTAMVTTSKGAFSILLDDTLAPVAANNFVVLARYRFFDGVAFHRIIPGFVIQTGDATGDPPGTGGPGYRFGDELPTDGYPDFSVAMANSGANTNGSQWFVVLPGAGAQLAPSYSRFGQVVSGQDVAAAIGAAGTQSAQGTPTEAIVIQSVTIIES